MLQGHERLLIDVPLDAHTDWDEQQYTSHLIKSKYNIFVPNRSALGYPHRHRRLQLPPVDGVRNYVSEGFAALRGTPKRRLERVALLHDASHHVVNTKRGFLRILIAEKLGLEIHRAVLRQGVSEHHLTGACQAAPSLIGCYGRARQGSKTRTIGEQQELAELRREFVFGPHLRIENVARIRDGILPSRD